MDFTHFDENGNAIMIDVSSKDTTQRSALASGEIYVGKEILEKIENHQMKKGDVLLVLIQLLFQDVNAIVFHY